MGEVHIDNYNQWIQDNRDNVVKFINMNNYTIYDLILSSAANMTLRMNKIVSISDLIGMSEDDIATLDYANPHVAREIYRKNFFFFRDIKGELIDYVNRQQEEDACKSNDGMTFIEGRSLLSDDTRKLEYEYYLETHNKEIEQLGLSNRTYYLLKASMINTLLDAVELYPNRYDDLDTASIEEIKLKVEEEATAFAGGFTSISVVPSDSGADLQPLETDLDEDEEEDDESSESAKIYGPIINEIRLKEYSTYLSTNDVPLDNLDLSPKSLSRLKRAGINTLHDAVLLYPDGFLTVRFIGAKLVNEIRNKIEENAASYFNQTDNRSVNPLEQQLVTDLDNDPLIETSKEDTDNSVCPEEIIEEETTPDGETVDQYVGEMSDPIVVQKPEEKDDSDQVGISDEHGFDNKQTAEEIKAQVSDDKNILGTEEQKSNPDRDELYESKLTESQIAEMKDYLKGFDIPIDQIGLSFESCYRLAHARVNSLYDALCLYPNGFLSIQNLSSTCLAEIRHKIEEKAELFFNVDITVHNNEDIQIDNDEREDNIVIGSNPKIEASSCCIDGKPIQIFKSYLYDHTIPLEALGLSTRTYNGLKRAHIDTLYDALSLYPDGYYEIRNMGKKSVDEIRNIIESRFRELESSGEIEWNHDNDLDEAGDDKTIEPPSDAYEAILNRDYHNKVCMFFSNRDMPIDSFDFETRTLNSLQRAGIKDFNGILRLFPDRMNTIKGMGVASINDIRETVVQTLKKHNDSIMEYLSGNEDALYDDDFIRDHILSMYKEYSPFYGISFREFRLSLPESISDVRIKKCIGKMLEAKELEYVDFRCYRVYPSFYEVIKEMTSEISSENISLLTELYKGRTLEDIAKGTGVTRERIRQKTVKAYESIKSYVVGKYGANFFDEDYYAYLYENYSISRNDWIDYMGVPSETLNYLRRRYNAGSRPMDDAIADDNVSVGLKMKIIELGNKDKIRIDGIMLDPKMSDIEEYIISKYCRDEISFTDFYELYNDTLRKNGVPYSDKIYYTDEIARTRKNRLSDSRILLWKNGMRFRYYNINERDYQELYDTIGIAGYYNTGLSTLYWMNNFPEIMKKYDIRDQYELHNLLKKTIPEGGFNDIRFDRMPGISFGLFDRDQMIYDTMVKHSPISADDLADIMYREYGYDRGTSMSVYFSCIRQYYHDGFYSVNYKSIPDERASVFIRSLTDDFYFDDEVSKIYFGLFPEADKEELNPRSMQEIGFVAYSKYYLRSKWNSAAEYFRYLLMKEDYYDCSGYKKRYAYIVLFTTTLRELRASFDLFVMKDGTAISIDRLSRINVGKDDIRQYCEDVNRFVVGRNFFTLNSMLKDGFESSLDRVGFDNSFYEGILEVCGMFNCTQCLGTMVFSSIEDKPFLKKDFILSLLSEYDSIGIDEFMDYLYEEYGIVVKERYRISSLLVDTGIYYDPIMETIYRNKELYYDDFE